MSDIERKALDAMRELGKSLLAYATAWEAWQAAHPEDPVESDSWKSEVGPACDALTEPGRIVKDAARALIDGAPSAYHSPVRIDVAKTTPAPMLACHDYVAHDLDCSCATTGVARINGAESSYAVPS